MKTWITQTVAGMFAFATLTLASCEKDEEQVALNMSASPQITASATTATITPATASATAVTYSWTKADFGFQAAESYVLQIGKAGTNFASVQEYNMGSEMTKTFTNGELNGVYNSLDCNIMGGVPTTLEVRVKASVGDKADAAYSPVTTIRATPYQAQAAPADTWAIIGSATAGGWDAETPMRYDFCSRTWKITIPLTVAEFKFRANNSWTLNLGDDGADKLLEPNGANIAVPAAGTYDVVLDMNATPKPKYTLTKK